MTDNYRTEKTTEKHDDAQGAEPAKDSRTTDVKESN
jgi:hypothetical protein